MRKFGLIGFPLSHSFSERYFSEKFSKENILDCTYSNYPLSRIEDFPGLLSDESLMGLNVTIPYKEKVLKYLDELDPVAREIGAVNTIKITRKDKKYHLKGFNTDAEGFSTSVSSQDAFKPGLALVLGTGGSSKAVVYSLGKLGFSVARVSRNPRDEEFSYKDLNPELIKKVYLIVNTTPLGTYPDTDSYPDIPYHLLTKQHLLFDLVYNPPETRFLRLGKAAGAAVVNGYQMLTLQAEAAWRIWNEAI